MFSLLSYSWRRNGLHLLPLIGHVRVLLIVYGPIASLAIFDEQQCHHKQTNYDETSDQSEHQPWDLTWEIENELKEKVN